MVKKPTVSVVVYMLEHHKDRPCFVALKNQTRQDFEVITVDGSEGVSKARNEGIKRARADIIALTEADAIPENDWIEKIIFNMKNEFGIAGRVIHPRNDIFKLISESQFNPSNQPIYVNFDVLYGCNMVFRKEVFEEIGLFDESFAWGFNETEFGLRYVKKNKLKYCPDVIVTHYYARNLAHYLKKMFLWGTSVMHMWRRQGLSGGEILRRTVPRPVSFSKLSIIKNTGKIFLDLGILYKKIRQW